MKLLKKKIRDKVLDVVVYNLDAVMNRDNIRYKITIKINRIWLAVGNKVWDELDGIT